MTAAWTRSPASKPPSSAAVADPGSSYVAQAACQGLPMIAQKLGEEAAETVIAALSGDERRTGRRSGRPAVPPDWCCWRDKGVPLADSAGRTRPARRHVRPRRKGSRRMTESTMPIDPTQPYDDDNIFAKILRGEIPSATRSTKTNGPSLSTTSARRPQVHMLVIPKGRYVSWDDFTAKAGDAEIAGFMRAVGKVARGQGAGRAGLPADGQCRRAWRAGSAASARPYLRRRAARVR